MASPGRQEEMIDTLKDQSGSSVRRSCRVLGLRRQTYHRRKLGFRVEERDKEIIEMLHRVTKRFIAWGFWLVFYYLRCNGYTWNHKRVYRVWKQEQLHLRLPPKRAVIRRSYQELLPPERINEGWAMDFVSDWVVGPNEQSVRIINIMDERSRKALWTQAHSSISARSKPYTKYTIARNPTPSDLSEKKRWQERDLQKRSAESCCACSRLAQGALKPLQDDMVYLLHRCINGNSRLTRHLREALSNLSRIRRPQRRVVSLYFRQAV
jgi:putative transposase